MSGVFKATVNKLIASAFAGVAFGIAHGYFVGVGVFFGLVALMPYPPDFKSA
jgi:hypothetical protein